MVEVVARINPYRKSLRKKKDSFNSLIAEIQKFETLWGADYAPKNDILCHRSCKFDRLVLIWEGFLGVCFEENYPPPPSLIPV